MPSPGETFDRWVIECVLGRGGMATVYRVRHVQLGTRLALKVLHVSGPAIFATMMREGRIQGAVRHRNIVAVHDVIEMGDSLGLLMEWVDGPTLHALLAAGRIDAVGVDRIARDMLSGLAAAHAAGLVHRDLKPGNVLLDATSRPIVAKVTDFGLARALGTTGAGPTSASVEGTPSYMAPEQFGEAHDVDARTDVWAAGCVLYELVTGKRAFPGKAPEEVRRLVEAGRVPPVGDLAPGTPLHQVEAISRALLLDPSQRPTDAAALLRLWLGDAAEPLDGGHGGDELAAKARALIGNLHPAAPPSMGYQTWDPAAIAADVAEPAAPVGRPRWLVPGAGALVAIGLSAGVFAVVWSFADPALEPPPRGLVVTRLTQDPTPHLSPTLSPDGLTVVWSDGVDLMSMTGAGTPPTCLTAQFEPDATGPAHSPDGRWLAFEADGGVWMQEVAGGNPKRVLDAGYDPAWSPDSAQIVVSTARLGDPRAWVPVVADLRIVDIGTGASRVVLEGQDALQPHWSAVHDRLIFTSTNGGRTIRADGTDLLSFESPMWSPRWAWGGLGVFALEGVGQGTQVSWFRVDANDGILVGESVPVLPQSDGYPVSLAIAADARRLVLSNSIHRGKLTAWDFDPVALEVVGAGRVLIEGSDAYTSPSVSPNGEQIAFATSGGREDLYVAAIDGTGTKAISTGEAYSRAPTWSPDGDRLYFYGERFGGEGLFQVDASGGDPAAVLDKPADYWIPLWAPDGRSLAFTSAEPRVYLVDPRAGPISAQVKAQRERFPAGWIATAFSPDGARLAVGDARGRVGVMDVRGGPVTEIAAPGFFGIFAPDGRHLIVAYESRVFVYDLDAGTSRDLLTLTPAHVPDTPPIALSPDGRTLIVATDSDSSDLWLLAWE